MAVAAARGWRFAGPRRVARTVLDGRCRRLRRGDLYSAQAELAALRRHSRWLGDAIDVERFATGLARREKALEVRAIRPLLSVAFVVAAGLNVNFGNELLSLASFGLALVAVGGWFFVSAGLALLGMVTLVMIL
jgi:hypothetical protein